MFKKVYKKEIKKPENITFNIEQIPGESMAVRLSQIDKVLGYNNDFELYSNQYIPLIERASIYDRLEIQGELDSLTSGGAILHINVEDEKPLNKEQFKRIINYARELKTVYFAINYAYSECENGDYTIGKHEQCPICQSKIVQQYTRVVGFITPVSSWNSTRRSFEYENRKFYKNNEITEQKGFE